MESTTDITIQDKRRKLPSFLVIALFILCSAACLAQNAGCVVDGKTKEPMPFVNVSYHTNGRLNGTTTDANGNYVLGALSQIDDSVVFQCVGYTTVTKSKNELKGNKTVVSMYEKSFELNEFRVVASRQRYSRKNNPAVELMREVIRNKERNSLQSSGDYSYRQHDKTEVSLSGLTDSTLYHRLFRKINFVFDNMQESELNGKKYVPLYFMETLSESFYDHRRKARQTVISANKDVEVSKFLDQHSLEQVMAEVFGDIDIYDDKISLLSNEFISPISSYGILFYHYHIADTIVFDGDTCTVVMFSPANPLDYGFYGKMTVTNDSMRAVRKVQLNLPYNNSVNFVEQIRFEQDYQRSSGHLIVVQKNLVVDFSVPGIAAHGRKRTTFGDYRFDSASVAIPQSAANPRYAQGYNKRDNDYWDRHRLEPLFPNEEKIYTDAANLNRTTAYSILVKTVMAIAGGYVEAGPFDWGPVENTVSWNSVEGVRLRLGGKTNMKFNERLFFSGFVAYGLRDYRFKYNIKAMYSFAEKKYHQYEFPMNLLALSYEENTNIPGQEYMMGTSDRFFQSFGRGEIDKMTFDRKLSLQYDYETQRHFSVRTKVEHLEQEPLARLDFTAYDGTDYNPLRSDIFEIRLRYAPRERFYQIYKYRMPINNTSPVYTLTYTYCTPLFGAVFEYHKLKAQWQKRWFIFSLGFLDLDLEAGKIFGQVPYPLLFAHHANQNFTYQDWAFNMMNYFEFVSDEYVQLMANYSFNGFIFNRIPLIKKLKWREVFSAKAVWGRVSDLNMPGEDNPKLLPFPTTDNGEQSMFSLKEKPYAEVSAGIDNIFKLFRVDYVWRLTYNDKPNIARSGLRFCVHFAF